MGETAGTLLGILILIAAIPGGERAPRLLGQGLAALARLVIRRSVLGANARERPRRGRANGRHPAARTGAGRRTRGDDGEDRRPGDDDNRGDGAMDAVREALVRAHREGGRM